MQIEIDEKSGFCFGVVKAISTAEELLSRGSGTVCSLGDIVHNRVEVSRLEGLGLHTVTHAQLAKLSAQCTVLVRAHGEPPSTYAQAAACGIQLVDATCPVVGQLQQTVRRAWEEMHRVNGQVVILGKPGHAEVRGLTGQTQEEALVVETLEDLKKIDFTRPIYLLSQTTQPLMLFRAISEEILVRSVDPVHVQVHDTICRQVSNREPHLREFAARHAVVIFVSGRKSSNGQALFEVCRAANSRTHLVEEASELRREWFLDADISEAVASVGVCGATSTPKWLMREVAAAIQQLF